MRARKHGAAHTAFIAAALVGAALAGCAASPEATERAETSEPAAVSTSADSPVTNVPTPGEHELAPGYWAPSTAPTWVKVNRESTFVLTESDSDLLVFLTDKTTSAPDPRAGEPISRITWMISIPADAAEGDRFAFIGASEGGPPQGWALETGDETARMAPISGFVTILDRNAKRMIVDLKIFPIDEPEVPDLLEQVECVRVERPGAVAMAPIETRSGVPHAPLAPTDPPRAATDAVWPWGEIFGDYPPRKYYTK